MTASPPNTPDATITVALPLPLDVVSTLLRAVAAVYPNSKVAASDDPAATLNIIVPAGDRDAAAAGDRDDDLDGLAAGTAGEGDAVLEQFDGSGAVTSVPAELGRAFAHVALGMLDAADAPNYLSITMVSSHGNFDVVVHRPGATSVHQLRADAEARYDELASAVAALADADDELTAEMSAGAEALRTQLDVLRGLIGR